MSAQAAKRRRRQAQMGYRHIAPMDRPHYSKANFAKSDRKEQRKAELRKRGVKVN